MDSSQAYELEILSTCQTLSSLQHGLERLPPLPPIRLCGKSCAHLCWHLHVSIPPVVEVASVYISDRWEFVTTLDFEWEVYTGRRPWRWSFIVYVAARVLALVCIIISLVGFNLTRQFGCNVRPTHCLP